MKRGVAAALSGLVVLGILTVPGSGGTAPAVSPPAREPAAGQEPGPVGEAVGLAAARRTGRPVEVTALTTPTRQVFARPDGTMYAEVKTSPVRVRRGNGWAPIDTTLTRQAGGFIAPKASPADVRFSTGGDGPLASLTDSARRVELSWPGRLPGPRLAGDSATYPAVLPGVDLVVTATPTGFTEKLVVHTPGAARHPAVSRIRFGLRTENWTLTGDRLPAFMWDSSPRARKHPMKVAVGRDSLTVVPDPAVLSDPDLVYPLHLDPEVPTPRPHWAMVWSALPNQSYYDTSWHAQVGIDPADPAGGRWRSYFELDTSFAAGKHIISATFRATLLYSHSCAAEPVYLWHTGTINSGTTWSNAPNKISQVGAPVTTIKAGHEACPGTPLAEFDATSLVTTAAAQSWQHVTLALAADEAGVGGKVFENDARYAHKVPGIGVVYNSVPEAPVVQPTTTMPGCAGTPAMWVTTLAPELSVTVADADTGDRHGIDFEIRTAGAASPFHTPPRTVPGTYVYDAMPEGVLVDGGRYEWRARASDSVDTGPYSPWCPFTVDVTGPTTAPTVTSPHFLPVRSGQYGIRVDQVGQFTFGASGDPDVAGYDYEIRVPKQTPVQGRVMAPSPGAAASLSYRPLVGGLSMTYEIWVWCVDAAGKRGPRNPRYQFRVNELPAVVDLHFTDTPGNTASDEAKTGADGTLTLNPGVSWVDGYAGQGVHLDGTPGAGGVAAHSAVDTAQSFTVMAWVRLLSDDVDNDEALDIVGHSGNGFALRYQKRGKRWQFALRTGEAADAPEVVAASGTLAQVGVWTHLAGVHDPASGQIRLYVNGRLSGAVPFTTPWTASGPFRIGPLQDSPAWIGDLDEVTVFDTAVSEAMIRNDMGWLEQPGSEGHWRLDESSGIAAVDSSGNRHTAVLYSQAGWTSARHGGGAGFAGGWAHTDGPVIEPNASYTVSAWVKLDRLPAQDQYIAVSQDGRWDSRFKLGVSRGWDMPNGWVFAVNAADTPDDRVAGSQPAWVQSDIAEQVGVWTHLAGVYDQAAGQIRLYVNGRLSGTAPFAGPQPAVSSLVFGRWQDEGFRVGTWPGTIDDVHVTQQALSAPEIKTWMDWPKWGPNARWTFDEPSGTLAADMSDNDHTLALVERASRIDVPSGKALRLEGQTRPDWVYDGAHGRTGGPVVPAGRSFTVAGWGRLDNLNASAALLSQDGINDSGFSLLYDKSANAWSFRMAKQDNLTSDEYAAARGGSPQAGVWTHLAGVYDHSAGTLKLYVNGSLVGSTSYRATWFADRAFIVGREFGGGYRAPMYWWKGEADDVHVLDHAAAASEVGQIKGSPPVPPPTPVVSASGFCEATGHPGGWGVYVSGSIADTPLNISSAYVSYSASGVDPSYGSPSGTVSLSTSGRSFTGNFPSRSGWEFVGGSGASWTVTVTLSDGRSYSRSGYTSRCG
ncbi:DNRLRE domain-containing protein [Micromonospora sp. DR5-3]|uniref:LamG-like jellyroll fold domain-containing protein n=1 Tax=unclassified Micromonospora TaxID=2617518 RepID=UPI0011D84F3E|nr:MULTISPECIES: LamG-like jellyroll fold domain-containing protein [unclassified Micromonospora]MCW3815445.1 DNRLRE domain-containing protein [Micromonospora sp. DR5-3]TYC24258.1 LamG domain-containing protein [Micromonospora sp. MP36]